MLGIPATDNGEAVDLGDQQKKKVGVYRSTKELGKEIKKMVFEGAIRTESRNYVDFGGKLGVEVFHEETGPGTDRHHLNATGKLT